MPLTSQAATFSRILVPLDGSPVAHQAIAYASAIAQPDATLVLLSVMPQSELVRESANEPADQEAEGSHRNQEPTRHNLALVAEALRRTSPNLRIEEVVAAGDPSHQILATARELHVDLIIMTAHNDVAGRSGLGSVADHVVRSANLPVMVIRTNEAITMAEPAVIRRVVVPLDGSRRAAQALPVAGTLAKRLGLPVHLITVIDPTRVLPPALAYEALSCGVIPPESISGFQAEAQRVLAQAETNLRRLDVRTSADLIGGPTADCIAGAVSDGDIIVMASHGQGAATHRQLGSIAERLVSASRVPVMVIRAAPDPETVAPVVNEMTHSPRHHTR